MSDVEERTETSVELGGRVAERAESRMLIDGELWPRQAAKSSTTSAPPPAWCWRRTAAARPRTWTAPSRPHGVPSTTPTGRPTAHCASAASNSCRRRSKPKRTSLREELIAEVGCPAMTTQSAQLDWPLADALRYPARLIDEFEWERTLEGGGLFGDRNVRTVVKEPVGVVAAITPSNFPIEVILNKLGPGAGHRQYRRAQARPEHPVERYPARPAHRRAHRHPGRRGERRADPVQRGRPESSAPTLAST